MTGAAARNVRIHKGSDDFPSVGTHRRRFPPDRAKTKDMSESRLQRSHFIGENRGRCAAASRTDARLLEKAVIRARSSYVLNLATDTLPLRSPFRISGYTFSDVKVFVVRVRDGAFEGQGEACGVYYLNDEPDAMAAQIDAHRERIEAGISREELRSILPPGGARNALDCALWDLEARREGVPVWKLAGLTEPPKPLITTFTLGADEPAAMARGARDFSQALALKLKLTGELLLDIERVQAVRAARPDAWIGVDANQGFTRSSLERLIPALLEARVLLLEQPIARGCEADLSGLDCPIPIAADESVQGLADMQALVGRFQVVNIKLDKCGGLTEALQMAAQARRLGLRVMVGNMIGSSLAMAPAFVLGQLCDFVDLDGPLFLRADRSPGVSYVDGRISCPESVWGARVE